MEDREKNGLKLKIVKNFDEAFLGIGSDITSCCVFKHSDGSKKGLCVSRSGKTACVNLETFEVEKITEKVGAVYWIQEYRNEKKLVKPAVLISSHSEGLIVFRDENLKEIHRVDLKRDSNPGVACLWRMLIMDDCEENLIQLFSGGWQGGFVHLVAVSTNSTKTEFKTKEMTHIREGGSICSMIQLITKPEMAAIAVYSPNHIEIISLRTKKIECEMKHEPTSAVRAIESYIHTPTKEERILASDEGNHLHIYTLSGTHVISISPSCFTGGQSILKISNDYLVISSQKHFGFQPDQIKEKDDHENAFKISQIDYHDLTSPSNKLMLFQNCPCMKWIDDSSSKVFIISYNGGGIVELIGAERKRKNLQLEIAQQDTLERISYILERNDWMIFKISLSHDNSFNFYRSLMY